MSTWAPTVTLAPTVVVASAVTPVLTTTFSPTATSCLENRLTMLANRQYQIWMNEPLPVPGTTITDCYPSVYMNSFLNAAGGVTQPAFSPLVCPESYITQGPFTSNYIACCPSGYTLGLPTVNINKSRPAYGGTCYTPLPSGTAYKVIQYGADSVTATSTFAPSDTLAAAYAHPFEGFYFGVAVVASAGGSVTITNSEIAVMTGPSSSSTAAVATYTVSAGVNPVFSPDYLSASIGDTILFQFTGGNHTATQSTFDTPCSPLANGADSQFMPNVGGAISPSPAYAFEISSTSPAWFYSKQAGECKDGMVFAVNPTTEQSSAKFQAAAISTESMSSKSGLSAGAKAGFAIAAIVPALLAIILAAFCISKRRQRRQGGTHLKHDVPGDQNAEENKSQDYHEDVVAKDARPSVPLKPMEMGATSNATELPGYSMHEMVGSPGTFYNDNEMESPRQKTNDELTPLSQSPTRTFQNPQSPQRNPVAYTHYNEGDREVDGL